PDPRQKSADPQMAPRELFQPAQEKRPIRIVAELQAARIMLAVESERQLQEVMVDFWFNHFNVHAAKGEVKWYLTSYERDVIRPHALGKFGDLLRGTATHPAMLFYLDNWLSARPAFTVPAAAATRTASACWICCSATRPPRRSSRPSSCAASSPTSRRPRSSSAWRRRSAGQTATSRRCCARFWLRRSSGRPRRAERKSRSRSSTSRARCARWTATSPTRAPASCWCARRPRWA